MVSLGLLVVVLQILIAMLRNTLLEVSPNCQWDSAAAKSSWILLCTKYCWKSLLMFRWSGSIKTVEPRLHETLWKGRSSQALPLPADRSRLQDKHISKHPFWFLPFGSIWPLAFSRFSSTWTKCGLSVAWPWLQFFAHWALEGSDGFFDLFWCLTSVG